MDKSQLDGAFRKLTADKAEIEEMIRKLTADKAEIEEMMSDQGQILADTEKARKELQENVGRLEADVARYTISY